MHIRLNTHIPDVDVERILEDALAASSWDRRVSQTDPSLLVDLLEAADHPVLLVRAAQAVLNTTREERLQYALHLLERSTSKLARGVRMLVWVQLGQHRRVLAEGFEPSGTGNDDLELACHAAFAMSMSATQLGDYVDGLGHLKVCRWYALSLGMANRADHAEIESGRILLLMGTPDPDRLRAHLASGERPPRRQEFGEATLAAGFAGLGDYSAGLQAVRGASNDPTRNAPFQAFMRSMLLDFDPASPPDGYGLLAHAVHRLVRGDTDFDLPDTPYEPQRSWRNVFAGIAQVLRKEARPAGVLRLGDTPPALPDQRAFWALAMWWAYLEGAEVPVPPLNLPGILRGALGALRVRTHVLRLMARMLPDALFAATFVPELADELEGVRDGLAILKGRRISLYGEDLPMLGGVWGRSLISRALKVADRPTHRMQRDRFGSRLQELRKDPHSRLGDAKVLNPAVAIKALLKMSGTARAAGQDEEARVWNHAVFDVLDLLDDDVAEHLTKNLPVLERRERKKVHN